MMMDEQPRIHIRAFSIALGFSCAIIFLLLYWGAWMYGSAMPFVNAMGAIFPGLELANWQGMLMAFYWGMISGFIFGVLISGFYNMFVRCFYKDIPADE